jgi:hypothetical protein
MQADESPDETIENRPIGDVPFQDGAQALGESE